MATIAKQTPWQIQKAVVFAIFIRELQARFGKFTLGYLWALLEPLFFVLILSFVRGRFTGAPIAGLPPVVFFASGVLAFFVFRNIATTAITAVDGNYGLFNYQRVKAADALAARFLLELLILTVVAIIVFPCLHMAGQKFHYNSTLQTIAALMLLLMFTAGISLIFVVLGALWVEAKKVLPMVLRPLFFISGIFFPISSVPASMRQYLLWNPLVHAIEIIRESAFSRYSAQDASWAYLFWCSVISLAAGLIIYRLYRVRIVTSGASR